MPKRKREDDIEEVFSRFRNELHHALKVAKGFERQRQSKRLREPKVPADKKARIEKEVVVLKSLDLHQAAHAHFCSALLRVKSVAESPKLPAEIKAGIPKPELTEDERVALHNVTSALANRQEVRSATEKAIAAICKALGIPVPDKKARGKKSEEKAKPEGKPKSDKANSEEKQVEPERDDTKADSTKSLREKEARQNIGSDESDIDQEERAISQLDDLLASSSAEGDSEVEGAQEGESKARKTASAQSNHKPAPELDPMEITDDEEAGADDDFDSVDLSSEDGESDSESESESEFQGFSDAPSDESESESLSQSPPPKKPKAKAFPSQPSGSTFLPSLMGGYISGSDSEASDLDIAPQTHKNRRGQRARQAIWEKRYKAEAKHLKKQQQQGRDFGWDPKRGAVDGEAGKPWKRGIRNPLADNTSGGNDGGQSDSRPPPRKRDDTGPLHPSWEAKRKAKEAQSASVPFQGKKITFD